MGGAGIDDAAYQARRLGPAAWLLLDGRLDASAVSAAQLALFEALDDAEHLNDHEVEVVDAAGATRLVSLSTVVMPGPGEAGGTTATGEQRSVHVVRDITAEREMRNELAAFAGVVAHDLRNPLAAIDGWTELVADQLEGDGHVDHALLRELVQRVRSSSARMRRLISTLLVHATSGDRRLDVTQVDLESVVREVAAGRSATEYVTCGPLPPVRGDQFLLHQLLDNLVGNALKYVAPGARPEVEVTARTTPSGRVAVSVADCGIGIPEADRTTVFEEFHRAHQHYDGSGLGLAICRRIVHRHGGSIVARPNTRGVGTVFTFTLPG